MTRDEMIALDERIREQVRKRGMGTRPISDADRKRFEELKKEAEERR